MNKKNTLTKSETDWAKIDRMQDEDIDYSDIPKITDEMWAKGNLRKGFKPTSPSAQENFQIDRDIIEYFKKHGENYQTQINEILREYVEAHRAK